MAITLKLAGMGLLMLASAVVAFLRGMPWHWLGCAALGLSWVGDAMLAHYPPVAARVRDPFVAGMGAFALAQIVYIAAFWKSLVRVPLLHVRTPGSFLGLEVIGGVLPVYLLAGALFWVLFVYRSGQPAALKAATLVYGELLCAMAAFAFAASFTGVGVIWQLIVGGLLFLVSDGVIAAHIFKGCIPNEGRYDLIVWATYAPAQALLLWGLSRLY